VTILRESAAQRDGLFGALSVVFALALGRGFAGASTTSGRITVAVIFGLLTIGALVAGIVRHVRAPWLAITDEAIERIPPGSRAHIRFERATSAELRFATVGSYRSRTLALQQDGNATPIPLAFFTKARVRDACTAHGWHFA
jgi:hypothetical protein